jgi:hypothetical protein
MCSTSVARRPATRIFSISSGVLMVMAICFGRVSDVRTFLFCYRYLLIVVHNVLWYKSAPFGRKSPLGAGNFRPPVAARGCSMGSNAFLVHETAASAFSVSNYVQALTVFDNGQPGHWCRGGRNRTAGLAGAPFTIHTCVGTCIRVPLTDPRLLTGVPVSVGVGGRGAWRLNPNTES